MYRYQTHVHVRLTQWRQFHAELKKLNALLAAKGLVEFQLWESKLGKFDAGMLIADYESLAEFERENDSMHSDPDCMATWREMCTYFDETPWTDLWWTPSPSK